MRILMLLIFSLSAFTPIHSVAADLGEYSALYGKCIDKNGPIDNAVVELCSGEVSDKAKAEITRHYNSIYSRILSENKENADKFERSQKAWIQYRNLHCDLAGIYIGSPMYGFCPMNLNAARAVELRELDQ